MNIIDYNISFLFIKIQLFKKNHENRIFYNDVAFTYCMYFNYQIILTAVNNYLCYIIKHE
jgi:hypothetical protein